MTASAAVSAADDADVARSMTNVFWVALSK